MPEGRVQLIAYSPRLDTALRRLISGELETSRYTPAQSETTPKQTLLASGKVTQAEVDYSYNGYFKIIDASMFNDDGTLVEAKIKIVDGATYDEETGISGTSRCKVNNAYFDVPQAELAVTSQALSSGYAVFLHYNKNSSTAEETITLEFDETITEDSYNCYYQVGRVLADSNENSGFSIQQDHVVGVPQMFLFGTCSQNSFVE